MTKHVQPELENKCENLFFLRQSFEAVPLNLEVNFKQFFLFTYPLLQEKILKC